MGRDAQAQFKILAVIKRVVECRRAVALACVMCVAMDGNRRLVEHGPEAAALGEDVAQVG